MNLATKAAVFTAALSFAVSGVMLNAICYSGYILTTDNRFEGISVQIKISKKISPHRITARTDFYGNGLIKNLYKLVEKE